MERMLKQSTATTLLLGPFVDETDGQTAETALTISQADVLLWKEGGTTLAQKSEATSCTHRSNGLYTCPIDTTDTNTLGILTVSVDEAGALPIRQDYFVVAATVYDSLKGNTGAGLRADAVAISGDTVAADNLETAFDDTAGSVPWTGIIDQGTAQSATATTLVLRAAAAFANDEILGATIYITGGTTGVGQSRVITDYVSATDTATVDAWTTTPSGTITYKIVPTAPNSTSLPIPVNVTQIAGSAVDTGSAQLGVNVVAAAANSLTASALAADAVTEIQNGLATAAALDTVDNFLDTEIAAILALLDDPRTEPGQGAPPVNPDLATKIDYLYKAWRNRSTVTATEYALYADDGTTKDHEAALSDDTTTFVRGEVTTGA